MSKETMYDSIIQKEAVASGLPAEFIKSIIKKESMFNEKCKLANNHGLMQITLPSAKEVGYRGTIAQLYAPATNIKYGAKYLKAQVDLWNKAPTANDILSIGAASYNLGQGNIRKASAIAVSKGLHPLRWDSIAQALPALIKPRGLTRRRVNITLNYVNLVNAYMKEFLPIHDNTIRNAEAVWEQG